MRIIKENAENYIKALAVCIGRDPASLEFWRCIHLSFNNADDDAPALREGILQGLKEEFKNVDCDVVLCADKDILLIGRTPDMHILYQLQAYLQQDYEETAKPEGTMYDLFYAWREIRKILLCKVPDTSEPAFSPDSVDFGEIDSLSAVFAEEKRIRSARQPLHMLLVEDDDLTRRLVLSLFKEKYALFSATTAQEAIATYMLHAPDIVFLDINLPDHDGFQVLRQILASDPKAYVVMFSGNSYLDNVTHALNAGAAGFIAKPFSKEKMRHYIEDCAIGRQCN